MQRISVNFTNDCDGNELDYNTDLPAIGNQNYALQKPFEIDFLTVIGNAKLQPSFVICWVNWEKIPMQITVLAQCSCSIFTHTDTHARKKLFFENLLHTEFYTVYNILYTVCSILYCIQYEINRKIKMLQEYWASTLIFIENFSSV